MGKRLYVGNLPFDTDDAALLAAFSQDGRKVERVHIVMDRDTGRPRGFAFVEMSTDEDAKKAITAMDGFQLNGRPLRVNEAEERRPGGGGGGGPSRGPGGPGGGGGGPPRGPSRGPSGGGGGGPSRGYGGGPIDRPKFENKYEKKNHKRKHDKEDDFDAPRGFRDDEDA